MVVIALFDSMGFKMKSRRDAKSLPRGRKARLLEYLSSLISLSIYIYIYILLCVYACVEKKTQNSRNHSKATCGRI